MESSREEERRGEITQYRIDEGCQSNASHCVYFSYLILSYPILSSLCPMSVSLNRCFLRGSLTTSLPLPLRQFNLFHRISIPLWQLLICALHPATCLYLCLCPLHSPSVTATSLNLFFFFPNFSSLVQSCPALLHCSLFPRAIAPHPIFLTLNPRNEYRYAHIHTHTHTHTHTHMHTHSDDSNDFVAHELASNIKSESTLSNTIRCE